MVILGTTLSTDIYGYCRPSTIAMLTIDLGKRKAFGSFLGAFWHQHPQAVRALPEGLENCSIDICNPIPSWELTYHPKKGCRIYMTFFFLNHEIPTRRSLPVHTAYWCSFFLWFMNAFPCFRLSIQPPMYYSCMLFRRFFYTKLALANWFTLQKQQHRPCCALETWSHLVSRLFCTNQQEAFAKFQGFHHCFPEAMTAMMQLPLCGGKAESRSGEVWKDQTLWGYH